MGTIIAPACPRLPKQRARVRRNTVGFLCGPGLMKGTDGVSHKSLDPGDARATQIAYLKE